mgnify:CR=1 FL=1
MKFFKKKKYLVKKKPYDLKNKDDFYSIVGFRKEIFFFNKTNFNYLSKFINIILKKGKKLKINLILSKVFSYFFYIVSCNNFFLNDYCNNLDIFKYTFKANKNFFFVNAIFKVIVSSLLPSFKIKSTKVNKRKNPEIKDKYTMKAEYVFKKDRKNMSLKWLSIYSNTFLDKKFSSRLFKSIFYTYTEGTSSFLFFKKVSIYNFYMQSKKKKDKF